VTIADDLLHGAEGTSQSRSLAVLAIVAKVYYMRAIQKVDCPIFPRIEFICARKAN